MPTDGVTMERVNLHLALPLLENLIFNFLSSVLYKNGWGSYGLFLLLVGRSEAIQFSLQKGRNHFSTNLNI
jgi:hypothetical protein